MSTLSFSQKKRELLKAAGGDDAGNLSVSRETLGGILKAHAIWVNTGGLRGQQADLSGASLAGIDMAGANLRRARLCEVNLQGADLRLAKLHGADLEGANLQSAFLSRADLQGANLRNADLKGAKTRNTNFTHANLNGANLERGNFAGAHFREADMRGASLRDCKLDEAGFQDTDLEGAKGLLPDQLAGADVSGAKLPESVSDFVALEFVAETSKIARKIFYSLLAACAYALLTAATTRDALLAQAVTAKLPIINTEIPLAGFYWVVPLILVVLYFYLHAYLQRLWRGLGALPAVFPDGKPLDEKAYPWLLNGLVRTHFTRLKGDRPPLFRVESYLSIGLAWCFVPATLLVFWWSYLPRQDWTGTGYHIVLLVLTITGAVMLYRLTARVLRRREEPPFRWHHPWQDARSYQAVLAVACLVIFTMMSIRDVRIAAYVSWFGDIPAADEAMISPSTTFDLVGYRTDTNLSERDALVIPADITDLKLQIGLIKGPNFSGLDFSYAYAAGAFLAKANLRDANLEEAVLRDSNLRKAVLEAANLHGAVLNWADFAQADLRSANLGAAELEQANFAGADLTFANLVGADLQGAQFGDANLDSAALEGADLQAADLREARNLVCRQLTTALNWDQAFRDEQMACGMPLPEPFVMKSHTPAELPAPEPFPTN